MNRCSLLSAFFVFILLITGCNASQPGLTPSPAEPTLPQVAPTTAPLEPTATSAGPTPTPLKPTPTPLDDSFTLYVKAVPSGMQDCRDWVNACDLQKALFKSPRRGHILVAAGIYYPGGVVQSTFHLESGVEIYGGFPPAGGSIAERDWLANPTVLSGDIGKDDITDARGVVTNTANIIGENAYHVVTADMVDKSAVLDGFIITAGYASQTPPRTDGFGAGMLNWTASPTLNHIIFQGNTAGKGQAYFGGGGMFNIHDSNPTLTNVTFIANTAGGGAGMLNDGSSPFLDNVQFIGNQAIDGSCMDNNHSNPVLNNVLFESNISSNKGCLNNHHDSNPSLTHVTFTKNSSRYGSGMYNYQSSPTMQDVSFFSNISTFVGGAIFNEDQSDPILNQVLFSGNSAVQEGGGIYNAANCNPALTNVAFISNTVSGQGGGGGMKIYNSHPTLTNVTFSGNHALVGGGIDMWQSNPTLTNVTLSGNTADRVGGGIYGQESTITIMNSIIWGNSPADRQLRVDRGASLVTYSIIAGGYPGSGNLDANPHLLALADNGGFTPTFALALDSPAIDAGSPTNCPQADQRAAPRPQDGNGDGIALCDMGAYEAPALPPP